jgi:hypothetical protein
MYGIPIPRMVFLLDVCVPFDVRRPNSMYDIPIRYVASLVDVRHSCSMYGIPIRYSASRFHRWDPYSMFGVPIRYMASLFDVWDPIRCSTSLCDVRHPYSMDIIPIRFSAFLLDLCFLFGVRRTYSLYGILIRCMPFLFDFPHPCLMYSIPFR